MRKRVGSGSSFISLSFAPYPCLLKLLMVLAQRGVEASSIALHKFDPEFGTNEFLLVWEEERPVVLARFRGEWNRWEPTFVPVAESGKRASRVVTTRPEGKTRKIRVSLIDWNGNEVEESDDAT